MIFKEMERKEVASDCSGFAKERKTLKIKNTVFWGVWDISC